MARRAACFAGLLAAAHAFGTSTAPRKGALSFPGSRILTPQDDAALTGFVAAQARRSHAHTRWALCFSSFTDDAHDPSAFHARCDRHNTTVVVAQHGQVPRTGSAGRSQRHVEYDAASPAWAQGASWTFGGYVRAPHEASTVAPALARPPCRGRYSHSA